MKALAVLLLMLSALLFPVTVQSQPAGGALSEAPSPGPTVFVRGYAFSDNSLVSDEELAAALEEFTGRELTFFELQVAVSRVRLYYLALGYPVVEALLPAQEIVDGIVHIQIVEGRLGTIAVTNESKLKDSLAAAILEPLDPGAMITSSKLDRALLLLSDVPGLITEASLTAGSAFGTTDLVLRLRDDRRSRYELSFNNFGGEETGRIRTRMSAGFLNVTGRGDVLEVSAAASGALASAFSVEYSLLAGRGLRVGLELGTTNQELGGEFAGAGLGTSSRSAALSLVYPWVRTGYDDRYVEVSLGRTHNANNVFTTDDENERTTLAVGVRGSGSGISGNAWQYRIRATHGVAEFLATGNVHVYRKLNADVAYVQALASDTRFSGSLAAQWAFVDLDGGEKMVISGPGGVRGHPLGDAGDMGLLARLELARSYEPAAVPGVLTVNGFVDAGVVQHFRFAPDDFDNVTRRYGYGIGLQWNFSPGVALEIQRAWPVGPGAEENRRGQMWIELSVTF